MIIIFGGCTINMTPTQELVEKKVPVQLKMKQHKLWPQEKKEYWYARYFYTMANHPTIKRMLRPDEVFEIVKCTIAKYEKDHDFEWFLKNLGETQVLTQANHQYVYDTTTVCANITKAKNIKPIDVKGMI